MKMICDQLSRMRVNLHGATDPTSSEGYELDKVMVIVKHDIPENSVESKQIWRMYCVQQLMEDRSWKQLRVPLLYLWPKEHAGEEKIDTYQCVDDITRVPKDLSL